MPTRRIEIRNEKGLHARASAKLVETAERFDATATVRRDGLSAAADSIMGLLMLTAARGTVIEIETSGPEAEPLMEALDTLVSGRFGEEM